MDMALLLIDIQNDYFPGGKMEVEGAAEAGAAAGALLEAARQAGIPVLHVRHVSLRPGATFFLPGTPGADINTCVSPIPGETVFEKHFPNSFRQTKLEATLRDLKVKKVVIAGMMSQMCIDATTRAAFDLGFECVVVHDACAARSLAFGGKTVKAAEAHGAFMAALGSTYARMASASEIVSEFSGSFPS